MDSWRLGMLSLLLSLLVGSTTAQSNCTTCPDNRQTCCGTTHCCPDDSPGSYFCCTGDASCCRGVCCITETTFCCNATAGHPDRCCPRWSLCCPAGQFGCCTPLGTPWDPSMGYEWPPRGDSMDDEVDAAATSVYALFLESMGFRGITIDTVSGEVLKSVPVQDYNTYSEMTRIFSFDEKRSLFYLLEANFSTTPESNLTLYAIDPATGVTTAQRVKGADYFPTAFYYHCGLDQIIMATQPFDQRSTAPFSFYAVNPTTAQATFLSTAALSLGDAYSGWFHTISSDGKTAYRLGYGDPLNAQNFGLGITNISQSTASSQWSTQVPIASGHSSYLVGSIHPVKADLTFLSLSPRTDPKDQGLDLVQWSYGGQAAVVASLGSDSDVRGFGTVAGTLSCDAQTYTAALYKKASLPKNDKWELVVVDLLTGAVSNVDLGKLMGATNSVSGIGTPFTSTQKRRLS